MTIERRAFAAELRAKGRRLSGYAATFGNETRIADFTEVIEPGAFNLDRDVLALVDHDVGRVLARTRSKTLRLEQDSKGLAFDLDLPSTSYANDVLALVERDDVGGMSFGFQTRAAGESWDGDRRSLVAVDLHEISVVSAWPAYENTVVQARSRVRLFPIAAVARRYLESL